MMKMQKARNNTSNAPPFLPLSPYFDKFLPLLTGNASIGFQTKYICRAFILAN